jgi:hypothetical protein
MSKSSDIYTPIDPKEAERLFDSIEDQLKRSFEKIRKAKFNPNTKGGDYENIVKTFFEDHLGDAFDFLTRFGVLDAELKANSIFKPIANEFDVVAIYKNAVPKLKHHHLVQYDAVAFILEVKQTLRVWSLQKDLMKLKKLNELKVSARRFYRYADPRSLGKNMKMIMPRPLRILLYYEGLKSKSSMEMVRKTLVDDYPDSWDIFMILKNIPIIVLNKTLPMAFTKTYRKFDKHPLVFAILAICFSVEGYFVDSSRLLWNLFLSIMPKYEDKRE